MKHAMITGCIRGSIGTVFPCALEILEVQKLERPLVFDLGGLGFRV